MSVLRWVTMPVDTIARDLDARILLGCAAARAGYGAIVGSQRAIFGALDALPPGLLLWNNIDRSNAERLRELRARGYRILVLDEEGLLFFSDTQYATARLSAEGMAQAEYMMAPNRNAARAVRGLLPQFAAKVVETGNPRIDLLRPEFRGFYQPRVDAHRKRFGRFILVNTNMTSNSASSRIQSAQFQLSGSMDIDGGSWVNGYMSHDARKLTEFREMVRFISRTFPDVWVVVRPHPVENFENWRRWLSDCPNVAVIHRESVHAWALAAAAVVHNSCTTGVESHLLGRTVISYRPSPSPYDLHLPNAVSDEVRDLTSLETRLRQAIADAEGPVRSVAYRCREALEEQVGALSGPFAFERIVDVFNRIEDVPGGRVPSRLAAPIVREEVKELVRRLAQRVPALAARIFGHAHVDFWLYHYQAFGHVALTAVRERVADTARVQPALAPVRARTLARGLFALTAA